MDTARYVFAVLMLVSWPPAFMTWYLIHPLARYWRRLGPGRTYSIVIPTALALAYLLYRMRATLVGPDLGTSWPLVVLAAVSYSIAAALELLCRRHLKFRILTGVPELKGDRNERVLLTEGIYGRVRHPRYVSATLGLLAIALFCNYVGTWALLAIWFPALWLLAVLEERELREWFGAEYDEYASTVPRFIPRLRRRADRDATTE